jgi:hypothetical protein
VLERLKIVVVPGDRSLLAVDSTLNEEWLWLVKDVTTDAG